MAFPGSYIIYKAISPSGKVYVGLTRQTLAQRRKQHFGAAEQSKRTGKQHYFHNALLKYGRAGFTWEILETGIPDVALAGDREKHFIKKLKSAFQKHGYNLTPGGQAGRPPRKPGDFKQCKPVLRSDGKPFASGAAAARSVGAHNDDAISRSIRRQTTCGGFTFQRISKQKYLAAMKAWDAKVTAGHVEQKSVWTKSRNGYKHTDEARKNMSLASKPHSEKHKAALDQFRCKTVYRSDGQTFDSITEAGVAHGLSRDQVAHAIQALGLIDGFLFGFDPISMGALGQAIALRVSRSQRHREVIQRALSRSVVRSDGKVFVSRKATAQAVGTTPQAISYSIRSGKSRSGFTFTAS